jgi:DNA-binding response OmpR family regulator
MGRPTLLLVEETELAVLFQQLLRSAGYRALICRTGGQALRICARLSARIHLVVTTFRLPDMDGGELAFRLQKDYPDLKVLGMSVYGKRATRFDELGFAFIQKPFNSGALVARVREILGE